jgi:hypothetical protein
MIGRYPLRQRHIAVHRRLLLLFSTHASVLNQTPVEKKYQNEDFFRSLFSHC